MSRAQERRIEQLGLLYGRLAVKDGFADRFVEVICEDGRRMLLSDEGGPDGLALVRDAGVSFSADFDGLCEGGLR